MPQPKIWHDNTTARFVGDTFKRIRAVLRPGETRPLFIADAVAGTEEREHELETKSQLQWMQDFQDFTNGINTYFRMSEIYKSLYQNYCDSGVNLELNPVDNEFAAGTPMQAYLDVGIDALRVIIGALVNTGRQPPKTILDFPSGSGRVTRHLQAFFPDAVVVASDLYDRHLQFCAEILKVETIVSRENFDEIDFQREFDLIFCGSLLTHLPEPQFRAALRLLARSLSPTGIAIVTVHGRRSEYIQKNKPDGWNYLPDVAYAAKDAETLIAKEGFAYVEYDSSVTTALFPKQQTYGVSFSRPHWTMSLAEDEKSTRILGYIERGWHNHQDVLIIGRPEVNAF